jgi:hypothetical protein
MEFVMCDFSLHAAAQKPAEKGHKMKTARLAYTGGSSGGFFDADDPSVAVCLQPGTEVAFDKPPLLRRGFRAFVPSIIRRGLGEGLPQMATFRKVDLSKTHTHHDALEFVGGRVVKIDDLKTGLSARVVSLPVSGDVPVEQMVEDVVEKIVQQRRPFDGNRLALSG